MRRRQPGRRPDAGTEEKGAEPVTSPLLAIQEVSAHAEGAPRPLLDQVGLTVEPGTVVAVIGPSGSGKTTLGLAALGASREPVRLSGRVLLEAPTSWPSLRRRAVRCGRDAPPTCRSTPNRSSIRSAGSRGC
ncbi:ATP-binding cassette domain-containing protein [Streptomyces sp. NPDC003717]|uniref:ATP-binding cassette domain-containing protein n=1 Tax=Streptomyces sp. NPDC003717 TaxID=3154276 RepID=UPI0033A53C77